MGYVAANPTLDSLMPCRARRMMEGGSGETPFARLDWTTGILSVFKGFKFDNPENSSFGRNSSMRSTTVNTALDCLPTSKYWTTRSVATYANVSALQFLDASQFTGGSRKCR